MNIFTTNMHIKKSFSLWMFYASVMLPVCMQASQADIHLVRVTQDVTLRTKLADFIDKVLKQTSSENIFSLIDEANLVQANDLYAYLLDNISRMQSLMQPYHQLCALNAQKSLLTKQALQLLPQKTCMQNCVEIGTPAPYSTALKKKCSLSGTLYAVLDEQRLSDPLQAHSYNPLTCFCGYDQYVPMNNYDPLSEEDIPSDSVDLVICFIGLHHIPPDKLDAYVQSLYRIIRPGGLLLVREHDARDANTIALVDAAHSVFNVVVSKTSVIANQQEIRNFQPLEYWIELLGTHGFTVGKERLVQDGDPTLNTMIRFSKEPRTEKEYIATVSSKMKDDPDHTRSLINTFLSAPEWLNVDASQEYGDFINHTPFYKFPYFSYVAAYWKVFFESWNAARKRKGHVAALTSDCTPMNLFIGVSMTIEYIAKGLVSLPIAWMYSDEEALHVRMLVKDPYHELVDLDERIRIIQKHDHDLYQVEVPRYKAFLDLMKQLAHTNSTIIEIAGQKEIQCKVRYTSDRQAIFPLHNGTCEYTWQLPTQTGYTYAAISTTVEHLLLLIKECAYNKIELLYIHDY